MIINSWCAIEKLLLSGDRDKIYLSIKRLAEKKQLYFVDDIAKLKLILIALPYDEKRFEIFNLPVIQACLNSMSFKAEEFIELYEIFIPQDALKFLQSESVQEQLSKISLSINDYKDMLLYFKEESQEEQKLVKKLLNKVNVIVSLSSFWSWSTVGLVNSSSNHLDENKEQQKGFNLKI